MSSIKMKPLLPSLKEKKRYIVFEVLAQASVHQHDVHEAITNALYHVSGVHGLAEAGMQFIPERWNAAQQRGVLRVSTVGTDMVKSAFPFIQTVGRKKAIVRSLSTSGILGKTEKYMAR